MKTKNYWLALLLLLPITALAHEGEGAVGGFLSGFKHPILGWDHLAAMVAVGIWGGVLARPAIWVLPIAFPMMMAFGAVLGILGVGMPYVETGIAGSALILGLVIALAWQAPLWEALLLVGLFALFHGHAHGTELPESANALTYAVGFVVGTGLLHALGIGLGFADRLPKGKLIVQIFGGIIAAAGAGFLLGWL